MSYLVVVIRLPPNISAPINYLITNNYTYNHLDQLLTAGAKQYQYDGRGNLTQVTNGSNITYYTYNAADKLTGVTLPNNTNVVYSFFNIEYFLPPNEYFVAYS